MKCLARSIFLLVTTIPFCVCAATAPTGVSAAKGIVTVPMQLELNRPYIDVTVTGPNGHSEKVHAWVDTGGGAIMLSAGLADRLGLKPTAKATREEGSLMAPVAMPALRIGNTQVALESANAVVLVDQPATLDHTDAELALPGRFLQHYIVVFDYPAETFTLAEPGKFKPAGTAVKADIGESGMPVVWLSVAGKSWGFLMDTGGQENMISTTRLESWAKQHPDWRHVAGAYGPANMLLGPRAGKHLHMLSIGSMQWGPFELINVSTVARPPGVYEKWMSKMLGKPIIGSIAGNVLRDFRVTVDYPAGKVYLKRADTKSAAQLDMVGIMLEPAAGGGYQVARTAPGVSSVQAGDLLLKVDGHAVADAPFAQVAGWLSGEPGETRTLTLQRAGKQVTVDAAVKKIL